MGHGFKSNISVIYVSSVHERERDIIHERTNERKENTLTKNARLTGDS